MGKRGPSRTSCRRCRTRKARCDGASPCGGCERAGAECVPSGGAGQPAAGPGASTDVGLPRRLAAAPSPLTPSLVRMLAAALQKGDELMLLSVPAVSQAQVRVGLGGGHLRADALALLHATAAVGAVNLFQTDGRSAVHAARTHRSVAMTLLSALARGDPRAQPFTKDAYKALAVMGCQCGSMSLLQGGLARARALLGDDGEGGEEDAALRFLTSRGLSELERAPLEQEQWDEAWWTRLRGGSARFRVFNAFWASQQVVFRNSDLQLRRSPTAPRWQLGAILDAVSVKVDWFPQTQLVADGVASAVLLLLGREAEAAARATDMLRRARAANPAPWHSRAVRVVSGVLVAAFRNHPVAGDELREVIAAVTAELPASQLELHALAAEVLEDATFEPLPLASTPPASPLETTTSVALNLDIGLDDGLAWLDELEGL